MEQVSIHECECEICKERQSPAIMSNHRLMNLFMSRLDEQERQWYAAVEATKLGHGGLEAMAQITGLHINTIRRGQEELTNELAGRPSEGVRVKGGGRPTAEKKSPEIASVIENLVSDETAGLPTGPGQWVRKSLSKLAQEVSERVRSITPTTIKRLIEEMDYRLLANRKSLIKQAHPDQDRQFRYLKQVKSLF